MTILIVASLSAVSLALWLNRRRLMRDYDTRVEFTKGRVMIRDAIMGTMLVGMVLFVGWSIDKLDEERDARLRAETEQLVTMDRLDSAERDLRRYARFIAPNERDILVLFRRYRIACSRSAECRRQFAASINRVLRVQNNRIVPAPGSDRATPPAVEPRPSIPATPGARGPQGFRGPPGPAGPRGETGRAGADVNSALVDGLDNRLAAVERGLGSLLQGLCAPGIARLLSLLRLCG